jgi:hypothetical protein
VYPDFRQLDPRTALRIGVWVLLGLLLALGVRSLGDRPDDNPAYDALSKAHTRRMAADSVALVSAREALVTAQGRVATHIATYRTIRDTLRLSDTVAVRVFVERADSVVRSCSALAVSCDQFRVRADSTIAGLRLDRDRWRLAAESARPSGLRLAWDRVKVPLAFVAGAYVGSRVVR